MGNDAKVLLNKTTFKRFLCYPYSTSIPEHTGPGGANIEHIISPPSSLRGRSSAGPPRQSRTCSRGPSSSNLTELTSHARPKEHQCSAASRHRVRVHRELDW